MKKNYRLFKGKSGFPVYVWALFGSYRDKIKSIYHLFPFRPYFRVISGVFTGNMQAIFGLFTFYHYFTGSLWTALSKEYPIFYNFFLLPNLPSALDTSEVTRASELERLMAIRKFPSSFLPYFIKNGWSLARDRQ